MLKILKNVAQIGRSECSEACQCQYFAPMHSAVVPDHIVGSKMKRGRPAIEKNCRAIAAMKRHVEIKGKIKQTAARKKMLSTAFFRTMARPATHRAALGLQGAACDQLRPEKSFG